MSALRTARKPATFAWLLLGLSPFPILLGVALLALHNFLWAAIFVGAGVFNFVRSLSIIWRWRRALRSQRFESTAFVSERVSWAPARFHRGLSVQQGLLVVRPSWVAFLPSAAPVNLLAAAACALGGFVRSELGTRVYDLAGAWQQAELQFDERVLEAAKQTGHLFRATDSELLMLPRGVMFRSDEKTFAMCDAPIPAALLVGWRIGKPAVDAREQRNAVVLVSALPGAMAAILTVAAVVQHDASIYWGVAFWGALSLIGPGTLIYRHLRAR